ncbi:MAG: HEAT repeat domain-containing protein [Mastigocoleus sp. MO_167.B18]|uniref:HEAT repeat domain-containing protein n=1 Tax=Mastigocoleus sp. MO_188.B34 TaxID=3036635 RepID=UPI002617E170|nr:HEAT repeat domain-containing protein [Mastigocoleus sp. MO_188.B34]MDJ0697962.1 HEAT repeat domain-containing protein [Mastigocoleus sp. MO_188.B34]MDJ0772918.1 HEAT repeat domain-containing protein [Mastigocoleus sp. MO_167.B18]
MELQEIKANLNNSDFSYRLKAIDALNSYQSEIAVPLLKTKLYDSEFLVRSRVAMSLAKKQTSESFAALMEMMKLDDTPNVRAEAANSLSLFGKVSIPHLVATFYQDDHWIVRRSIIAVLVEMECPEDLFDVSLVALKDEDLTVQESGVDVLGVLANTNKSAEALAKLLELANHELQNIRLRAAYALKRFDDPQAKAALEKLRKDPDHRVVGAALENLLEK